jgi:GrpB-like predicted nucleotidyltransferase (UPF0157 family)
MMIISKKLIAKFPWSYWKTNAGQLKSKDVPMPEETLEEKISRLIAEKVAIVPYDANWPEMFAAERDHLRFCLPSDLIGRIEHFGSTAVPGLAAKPIIDILVEVSNLGRTRQIVPPILEPLGYDYVWRPSFGDNAPPFYAWFIKRDQHGQRTHHIHMVESDFEHWDRLLFRDYLIEHPNVARQYSDLKVELSASSLGDRVAYTQAKSSFIRQVTEDAKRIYKDDRT